jgi:hypothetical protein
MASTSTIGLEEVLSQLSDQSQEAAHKTMQRYGPPDDVLTSVLMWHNRGPWKRVIVNRDRVPHRFPQTAQRSA